jgi:hypothetical protein
MSPEHAIGACPECDWSTDGRDVNAATEGAGLVLPDGRGRDGQGLASRAAASPRSSTPADARFADGDEVAISSIQTLAESNRRATAVTLTFTLFLSSLIGFGLAPSLIRKIRPSRPNPGRRKPSIRPVRFDGDTALGSVHFYVSSRSVRFEKA